MSKQRLISKPSPVYTGYVLSISAVDPDHTKVCLLCGGKSRSCISSASRGVSQVLLEMIDQVCRNEKIRISDLTGIRVDLGPGSFTGIRVSIAVALALGYLIRIPVNGSLGTTLSPVYS